ncbi:mechanosensitive ion channel family protein [Candidatus Gracilibacteria bacterium]|nr:mechanosensitive ion channel family protein [Candidatus Gracilibacteria bacterium]
MEILNITFTGVWATPFLGYSIGELGLAFLVFFAILGVIKLFRAIFLRYLIAFSKKTTTKWDDKLTEIVAHLSQLFYVAVAFFVSVKLFLHLDPAVDKWVTNAFIVIVSWEALRSGQRFLGFALARTKVAKDKTSLHGLKLVANILLWSVGTLLVLSNIGINVSALAASFGIGGIAIALAAQNILGDLFSSFTIYFDKPFSVGDYIVIGANDGIVKKIGLKTTRIQTLQGEELIISNRELTETRVQNFQRLKRRRIVFKIGVVYGTPVEKLKKIPVLIQKIIDKTDMATFDRCRFTTFGDYHWDLIRCIMSNQENIQNSHGSRN